MTNKVCLWYVYSAVLTTTTMRLLGAWSGVLRFSISPVWDHYRLLLFLLSTLLMLSRWYDVAVPCIDSVALVSDGDTMSRCEEDFGRFLRRQEEEETL
jgi:hypothetical protein